MCISPELESVPGRDRRTDRQNYDSYIYTRLALRAVERKMIRISM